MTIHPIMIPASAHVLSMTPDRSAHVEAWTAQATEALQSVTLDTPLPSSPRVQRVVPGAPVSIPLDAAAPASKPFPSQVHTTHRHSIPIRRDSLSRREALLKGKEGSRQRRRWENDRLLNNPWAAPPLPSDWEVQPTYKRHAVPYYLAPLWDAAEFQRSIEAKTKGTQLQRKGQHVSAYSAVSSAAEDAASNVPREVRAKLKRARAAKGLLMDLEEEVRMFLQKWSEKEARMQQDGLGDIDSEDEEIVFVGRNGVMHDSPGRKTQDGDLGKQKLVFGTPADDQSASFGRWLVHSIATYYGLQTWSVTVGDPARREAYVGLGERKVSFTPERKLDLPRPLWGMV